ncbi:MAG: iron-containing redox enzyme family protein [Myxococcota bacterium]
MRRRAVERLAAAADAGDRRAWCLAQLAMWRLFHDNRGVLCDPDDLATLQGLFTASRAWDPPVEGIPFEPDVRRFGEHLAAAVIAASRPTRDPVGRMCAATREEWTFLANNMVAEALDFTRVIALASAKLPHRHARLLYHNLYDEAGRGDWAEAHFALFADFAAWAGVRVPGFQLADDDVSDVLRWTVPEVVAEINVHDRALLQEAPQESLGALFVVEHLVSTDFAALVAALRRLGAPPSAVRYFEVHVEGDPSHAADWLELVAPYARTAEEQRLVFAAAVTSARWYARGWDALCDGLDAWRATGAGPTLPAIS